MMTLLAMHPRHVACRSLKHAWEISDVVGDIPVGLRPLGLICLRCGTTRLDGVNVYGIVKSRKYHYPGGYLRMKGEEHIASTEYRLQLMATNLKLISLGVRREG